ncbi:MAG: glycoside hydrolase family 30 beta sandwich domain-containing protein [Bryobacteraceae bacterium]|nr:glycoside hydrolase family 30 beta sandwich domain-containing protein [Bryobacteraceae bacterium]
MSGVALLAQPGPIESWVTTADRASLFERQAASIPFRAGTASRGAAIVVDPGQAYQVMDGFGFALTGGSAELLMKMSPDARTHVLKQIFSTAGNGAGVSYLRLSIGSSDLNSFVFSYDDLAAGATDARLEKFDLAQDKKDVIPVLKELLAIQPAIKILGSPWSAPAWMKTNGNVRGGALNPEFYPAYALYLVKYIQAMASEGITIDAITIQNEPLNSRNTPSMQWQVGEQLTFLRDHLAPAFAQAGLRTKVILFDHNCDRPDYPLTLLSDPVVSRLADGTGFHHYGGDMSAMSLVHTARPDKNLYFTEQMIVERPGGKTIDIAQTVKRMLLDTTRNWSKNVILWNLAADPHNNPHTNNGGCSMCQGGITIDGDATSYNLAYYTIAHASKFVRPGSVRVHSTQRGDTSVSLTEDEERPGIRRVAAIENTTVPPNVAFRRPDGKIVLIVVNDAGAPAAFSVQCDGATAELKLAAGAVGTYIW